MWKINGADVFFTPDSPTYVGAAESLLHGSFSNGGLPEIFRTPGYPFLLIPAIALHHVAAIGLLENFFLAIAAAWLIWIIATFLGAGDRAASWAVLLYCFEPMSFLQSEKIMSDLTFATVFLAAVYLLLRFLRDGGYGWLAASALALGAATYVRPAAIYWWLFLTPMLLVFPRNCSWKKRLSMAILFPLIFAAALSPWVLRNRRVAGYTAFSATGDENLYFYVNAQIQADLEHKNLGQINRELGWADSDLYFRLHPEQRMWSQGQIEQFRRDEAKKTIFSHSGLYAWIHAHGCAQTLFNPGVTELLIDLGRYPKQDSLVSSKLEQGVLRAALWLIREYPWTAIFAPLMAAQLLFYYGLALVGVRRLTFDVRSVFLGIALYFTMVSGIPGAVSRWRTPIMPFVCVCAGVAASRWKADSPSAAVSKVSA
jgi:4-amino-4-deoxy-L-arabinose transferase-like glycosyltransferase